MPSLRLLLDSAASGAWNMAVDEALLEGAEQADSPTLRFYGWSEPTLSLGYFQPLAERNNHAASRHCPVVRRSTGGGAILHDRELTYSFALPHSAAEFSQLKAGSLPLYKLFHTTLIRVLKQLGVDAQWCIASQYSRPKPEPFLCFQRRAEGDVLADPHKLAGSAQRRHGRATLQHGSVLLNASPCAPELPGISDLLARPIEPKELIEAWRTELAHDLHATFIPMGLTEAERLAAERWRSQQFGTSHWVGKR